MFLVYGKLFSLSNVHAYNKFDLCCCRRITFLFQGCVVEFPQCAVLLDSNFHIANHSIGVSKIERPAEMKLFMLISGVLSLRGLLPVAGGHKFITAKQI